jgi:hypothetical protein
MPTSAEARAAKAARDARDARDARAATRAATRDVVHTVRATPKSPSPHKSPRSPRSPSQRTPSPRSPSPRSPAGPKRKTAVTTVTTVPKDPYATPFWPPSNYSVPAKVIVNSPTPLPRTLAKHKIFIEELRTVLLSEKIIDRSSPLFKELLDEQQKYNMVFHRLKPHNIICFVKCDYFLLDKNAQRVFHKGNKEPYFGNIKFVNLLKRNNMNMKWWGHNILYIHKNRF